MSAVAPKITQPLPPLKTWEVSGMGLPRHYISAYGREQAKSEYRFRYQLHSSRSVEAVEASNVSRDTA